MNIIHEIAKAIENRDEDALSRLSDGLGMDLLISEEDRAAFQSIVNGALEMMGEAVAWDAC